MASFQDGARAVQVLRSKAKDWNIDAKRRDRGRA